MKWCMLLLAMTACGTTRTEAAPGEHAPSIELHPVADLCVTKGDVASGAVREPTVRAYALGATGDAAQLTFTFNGDADTGRALANGELRRQMGIKLRAQDSCNVVYVMWRLDPKPKLEVSVKANPGKRTHEECGADGYTKIKPAARLAPLEDGRTYTLRAEIAGDELTASVDGRVVWRGALPSSARELRGPAGLRSDNVRFEIRQFSAPASAHEGSACKQTEEG